MKGFFYRIIMRIAHKYHWHYAPPIYLEGDTQLCSLCDEPVRRCEDDSIYLDDRDEPICEECYYKANEHLDV